ncbi:(d)CMP kinase [bacterium]|nr:(d)CMP kinase [bacterium]
MILTIDGPASSGKSTLALLVAREKEWSVLDSGLCYRLAGYLDHKDLLRSTMGESLSALGISFDGTTFMRDRRDISARLRTPQGDRRSSQIARSKEVREMLKSFFRDFSENTPTDGLVAEGRDMGTVVFPHAEKKIYLVADEAIREERRQKERGEPDPHLLERDRSDRERPLAPLRPAADAFLLDTTNLSAQEALQVALRVLDG